VSDDAAPSSGRLSDQQLLDWLRLIRSENVGPRTFRQTINRYGGAYAALEALLGLIGGAQDGRVIRIASRDEALREIEGAQALGVRFLVMSDADYPAPRRARSTARRRCFRCAGTPRCLTETASPSSARATIGGRGWPPPRGWRARWGARTM
jgi:hypothetical protein